MLETASKLDVETVKLYTVFQPFFSRYTYKESYMVYGSYNRRVKSVK